ncbi:MAG: hypothetical protein WKG07_26835 [Hymenobacter sp.]
MPSFRKTSLSVIKTPEAAARFEVAESPTELAIKTSRLRVALDLRSGTVRFATWRERHCCARPSRPSSLVYPDPRHWQAVARGAAALHLSQGEGAARAGAVSGEGDELARPPGKAAAKQSVRGQPFPDVHGRLRGVVG